MRQQQTEILWNQPATPGYFRMGITGEGYEAAKPGQFVTLRFPDDKGPLLRRPFSIHRRLRGKEVSADSEGADTLYRVHGIELLYRVVGPFTRRLSEQRAGAVLDLLGPLGNWFGLPEGADRIFLAAGGIGIAPLFFYGRYALMHGRSPDDLTLFVGGRTEADLLCLEEFSEMGIEVIPATEDGGAGRKGLVTEPLEERIETDRPDLICACGPIPMLRAVSNLARNAKIPCRVSVETIMACGIGACLGCAVETDSKVDAYAHVCKDGPVFDGTDLKIMNP